MHRIMMTGCVVAALVGGCKSEGGFSGQTAIDTWFQAPNNQIDILWVVDDSCSMGEEQEALKQGFVTFVEEMEASGTDFHIGLISTSLEYSVPERGQLIGDPPFLTNEEDYVALFSDRALLGTDGSDKEKGLEAAAYALSPIMTLPGGANEGFVRAAASLLVVMVSDEEDCSDGGALEGQDAEDCYWKRDLLTPVPQLVNDILSVKSSDPSLLQIGAIVGLDEGDCEDAYPGRRYMDAAALTGGLIGDICSGDWSTILADLGLTAVGIKTSFRTTHQTRVGSLEVEVDEGVVLEDEENGWTYDFDTWYLTFHGDSIPQRGQQVVASYDVQSGAASPIDQ
jgi:hypothetical protein